MRLLSLLFIALPFTASALAPKTLELRIQTKFGDREVQFLAKNINGKVTVERTVDGGQRLSRPLKVKEWNFLVKELKKLPVPKKIPPECDRAHMNLVLLQPGKDIERSSCFGLRTITSANYVRYAQLLGLIFE